MCTFRELDCESKFKDLCNMDYSLCWMFLVRSSIYGVCWLHKLTLTNTLYVQKVLFSSFQLNCVVTVIESQ